MKRYSEIIKEFSLFSLLFVLASAVAVSQDTSGEFTETIAIFGNDSGGTGNGGDTTFSGSTNGGPSESITIVETPSSEDVADTDTTDTNTAGSTNSEDNKANGNSNSGITPRNFNTDKLAYEEWNAAELLEWILSTVTSEDMMLPPLPPVEDTIDFTTTGSFTQDVTYTITVQPGNDKKLHKMVMNGGEDVRGWELRTNLRVSCLAFQ